MKQLYYVAHNNGKWPCKIYLEIVKAKQSRKSLIDAYNANGDIVETYLLLDDGTYLKG